MGQSRVETRYGNKRVHDPQARWRMTVSRADPGPPRIATPGTIPGPESMAPTMRSGHQRKWLARQLQWQGSLSAGQMRCWLGLSINEDCFCLHFPVRFTVRPTTCLHIGGRKANGKRTLATRPDWAGNAAPRSPASTDQLSQASNSLPGQGRPLDTRPYRIASRERAKHGGSVLGTRAADFIAPLLRYPAGDRTLSTISDQRNSSPAYPWHRPQRKVQRKQ